MASELSVSRVKSNLGRGQVSGDGVQRLMEEAAEPVKTEAVAPLAANPQAAEIGVPPPIDTQATPGVTAA